MQFSEEQVCRGAVFMSKEGRKGIVITQRMNILGETCAAATIFVTQMSDTELVRAVAVAEGLTLVPSSRSKTGYYRYFKDVYIGRIVMDGSRQKSTKMANCVI